MNLSETTVLILGLGESGLAMARWCHREGASVRVADTRSDPPARSALVAELSDVALTLGALPLSLLDGVGLLAVSPGLALGAEPQAALIELARSQAVPVWGEIEFFVHKLDFLNRSCAYAPHVLAITGTNGKTTVTSLTGNLCRRAGLATAVAGNISPALLEVLRQALVDDNLPEVWVLELSSFQLELAQTFAPDAAVVLNLSQDHLDWHGSMDAYTAAKARIFASKTVQVLNRDDNAVMGMVNPRSRTLTFGLDAPNTPDSFGVVEEHGVRWLAAAFRQDTDAKPRKRSFPVADGDLVPKRLIPVDALRIRGAHNVANALAALALCHAIDLPLGPLLHALREYAGEPHRVESIATIEGVEFFDDSKGTNVGATAAALVGLEKPIVLIAGGDGKGQDFTPLSKPVAKHARAVFLIGKDRAAIALAIAEEARQAGVSVVECDSLESAVAQAAGAAQPGDAVLLSPACASWDMFRNYKHRADVFIAAVHALAQRAHLSC